MATWYSGLLICVATALFPFLLLFQSSGESSSLVPVPLHWLLGRQLLKQRLESPLVSPFSLAWGRGTELGRHQAVRSHAVQRFHHAGLPLVSAWPAELPGGAGKEACFRNSVDSLICFFFSPLLQVMFDFLWILQSDRPDFLPSFS